MGKDFYWGSYRIARYFNRNNNKETPLLEKRPEISCPVHFSELGWAERNHSVVRWEGTFINYLIFLVGLCAGSEQIILEFTHEFLQIPSRIFIPNLATKF